MNLPSRQETSSSTSSGAGHLFTRRPWSESNESDNENKGPLGLTTVYNPPLSAIADLIFVHGLGEDPGARGVRTTTQVFFGHKNGYQATPNLKM
jgi:hypothetical protein